MVWLSNGLAATDFIGGALCVCVCMCKCVRASGLCLSLRLDEPCFIYVLYYIPSLYAYYLYIAWVPILCLSNPLQRGSTMPNGQNKKEKRKFVTKNAHLFNLLLFRGNNGVEFQTNRHREWVSGGVKNSECQSERFLFFNSHLMT